MTTAINTITIKANELQAVAYFSSKKDIRYYLNGVFFDMSFDCPIAVATNGHVLGAIKLPDQVAGLPDMSVIVPADIIERILKSIPANKRDKTHIQVIQVTPPIRGEKGWIETPATWKILANGVSMDFTGIDGKFPEYTRHIPKEYPQEPVAPATFDHANLATMSKAAKELGTSSGYFKITQYGPITPAICQSYNNPNFVAVIMPMRGTDQADAPAWHKIGVNSLLQAIREGNEAQPERMAA